MKHYDGALIESGLYDQAMVAGKEANGGGNLCDVEESERVWCGEIHLIF